jgi:hypothetical protein
MIDAATAKRMRDGLLHTVTIVVAIGLATPARATTLLPLRTQDASPLPSGRAEIVLGVSYWRNGNFPGFVPPDALDAQDVVAAPQLGFHIAAGDWVEIQAAFEGVYLDESRADGSQHDTFGAGDARLGTKVRLWRERNYRPVVAVHFATKLPNANKENRLGTDETDFMIEVLGSKQLGPVSAHVNLGIALLGNPGPTVVAPHRSSGGQDDLFTYAVAVGSPRVLLGDPDGMTLQLFGELVGQTISRFDNDRCAIRVGAQAHVGHWTFYTGVGAGLIEDSEDVSVSAGVLYAFTLERLAAWAE